MQKTQYSLSLGWFLSISRPFKTQAFVNRIMVTLIPYEAKYHLFLECYCVPGILYSLYPILSFKQPCEVVSILQKRKTQISDSITCPRLQRR